LLSGDDSGQDRMDNFPVSITFSSLFNRKLHVGFQVFTAVIKKNSVSWDVAPCGFIINRRFGGTCRLHIQDRRNTASVSNRLTLFLSRVILSTLKMEATCSSETSVYNKPIRRHNPEDGILQKTPCLHSKESHSASPYSTHSTLPSLP
jgi:hypothetical protein